MMPPRRAAWVMLPTSLVALLSACGGSVDATTPPSTIPYLVYTHDAPKLLPGTGSIGIAPTGTPAAISPRGSLTIAADGRASWGAGLNGGVTAYHHPQAKHLPYAAMLCTSGLGGKDNRKATYILVAAVAEAVSTAAALAEQRFDSSFDDCADDTASESLRFDSAGNLLRRTTRQPGGSGVTTAYTATEVDRMLGRDGLTEIGITTRLQAFRLSVDGAPRYVLVEQRSSAAQAAASCLILWKQ